MHRSLQMPNYPQNHPARQSFEQPSSYGGMNTLQNVNSEPYENQIPIKNCEEDENTDGNPTWKVIIAEVFGTAILIYVGCMSCTAMGFGFGLVLALQAFGHISGGYFNPAISIAALIMGEIKTSMFPVYVACQFAGGFIGYGLHYINHTALAGFNICPTAFILVTAGQAVLIESLATAFLAIACCSFWDKKNPSNDGTGSIKAALLLIGLIMAAGQFTGASFNTARSVPPAVFFKLWEGHWVYWIGPNIGGLVGALFYRLAILDKKM